MIAIALTGLLAAATTPAPDWTSTYPGTGGSPARIDYQQVVPARPSGYWAQAIVNDHTTIVRLDDSFQTLFTRTVEDAQLLRSTPDGGLVVSYTSFSLVTQNPSCILRRFGANGEPRWTTQNKPGFCLDLQVDGAGGVWSRFGDTRNSTLVRLGIDGQSHAPISAQDATLSIRRSFAAVPESGGAYLVGHVRQEGSAPSRGVVVRVDAEGREVWRWVAADQGQAFAFSTIAIDTTGNVFVLGQGEQATSFLVAASLSARGEPRWFRRIESSEYNALIALVPTNAGGVLAQTTNADGKISLLKLDGAGRESWRYVGGNIYSCESRSPFGCLEQVFATGDGSVWVNASLGTLGTTLTRLTSNGQVGVVHSFDDREFIDGFVTRDNAFVALRHRLQAPFEVNVSAYTADGRVSAPFDATVVPATAGSLVTRSIAPDQPAYLLTQSEKGDRQWLSRVDPNGVRRWQVTVDDRWDTSSAAPVLDASNERVCVAGAEHDRPSLVVACRSAETGEMVWKHVISGPSEARPRFIRHRVLEDGRVVVFAGDGIETRRVLLGIDGAELSSAVIAQGSATIRFAASGAALLSTSESNGVGVARLMRVSARGEVDFDRTNASLGLSFPSAEFTAIDTVLVVDSKGRADGAYDVVVTHLDARGQMLWSRSVAIQPRTFGARMQHAGNFSYLSVDYCCVSQRDAARFPQASTLMKLDLATGDVAWRVPMESLPFERPLLALDATGTRLLRMSSRYHRIRQHVIDTATGNVLADDFRSCATDDCVARAAALDANGRLRVVADTQDTTQGVLPRIYALDDATATPAQIPIAQPAIAGVWYAPYSTGQGLVVEFDPASRTVFAPWFTFTTTGANEASEQRWYSLQGVAAASAHAVELGIYQNVEGQFASPPVTTATRVGTATLEFTDCDHGRLTYRFDAAVNDGAKGPISLTRLTPRGAPCRFDEGSLDAVTARPAREGFDQAQSGAWFDPVTSGQGFMFAVTPHADTDAGLFVAAWFTYDPSGAADDPTRQHWFTLQNTLAGATGGRVQVPIYRTIGGRFDDAPTPNTQRVGAATVTFTGCASATLDYQFDDSEVAAPFARRLGTIALQRIGGCASASSP